MPPKRAASTAKNAVAADAATFDVAKWLAELSARGFKPSNVVVPLYLRGDLIPRINELVELIQADEDAGRPAVGVNDRDLVGERVAEYERLTAEFEAAGHIDFTFRPMSDSIQNRVTKEWKASLAGDERSDEDYEDLAYRQMAATCIDFPGRGVVGESLTVDALKAFAEAYGARVFKSLVDGFRRASESGGEVSAPFSPKPSRTPDTTESSNT